MTTTDTVTMVQELRDLVAEICAYDPDDIDPDALIFDDLGLDSISLLDVFVTMSRAYPQLIGVTPGDADLGDHTTYRDLETLLVSVVSDADRTALA